MWRVLQRCHDALCGVVVRRVQVEHVVDESKPERHLLLIGVSLPLHYPNPPSHPTRTHIGLRSLRALEGMCNNVVRLGRCITARAGGAGRAAAHAEALEHR